MANALNEELDGRHVVILEDRFQARYRELTWRVVTVKGGFGASPNTSGSALICEHVRDAEVARYEGYDVERFATEEEVAAAVAASPAAPLESEHDHGYYPEN